MSTPLSDILSLVAAHGKSQAAAFLQGEAVIAGSPDQEIWEHLARHDILWDGLTVDDQDQLRDAYLESFKQECARRLTPSEPVTSPLPVSVAPAASFGVDTAFDCLKSIRRYIDGLSDGPHKTAMTKGWNFMVYGMEDPGTVTLQPDWLKSFAETASPASSVVPAPLVPEVVKVAQEALETAKSTLCQMGRTVPYNSMAKEWCDHAEEECEYALTALRNYSPAPSPSVELLREAKDSTEKTLLYVVEARKMIAEDRTIAGLNAINLAHQFASSSLSKLNAALA